jgi:hypothetical protein
VKAIEQVMAVCRLSCLPTGINLVVAMIYEALRFEYKNFGLSHASGEMHSCVYICHFRSNGNCFSLGIHKCVNGRNGVCAFESI